jgi:hypothetical protein
MVVFFISILLGSLSLFGSDDLDCFTISNQDIEKEAKVYISIADRLTMETHPMYQKLDECAATCEVGLSQNAFLCKAMGMVINKKPDEIVRHYRQLLKDYAKGIKGNDKSVADGDEAYAAINDVIDHNEKLVIEANWNKFVNEIYDSYSSKKKLEKDILRKHFGPDPRVQTVALALLEDNYTQSAYVETQQDNEKLKKINHQIAQDKKFIKSKIIEEKVNKYLEKNSDLIGAQVNEMTEKIDSKTDDYFKIFEKQEEVIRKRFVDEQFGKGSWDKFKEAVDYKDQVENKNNPELDQKKIFLGYDHLPMIQKVDGENIISTNFGANEAYETLGVKWKGRPYKVISGYLNGLRLKDLGYSKSDVIITLKMSSNFFESYDLLHDHFGIENDQIHISEDGAKSKEEKKKLGDHYKKILSSFKNVLSTHPEIKKEVIAKNSNLENVHNFIPNNLKLPEDFGDVELTFMLLNYKDGDKKKFSDLMKLINREAKVPDDLLTEILATMQNGLNDTEQVLSGVDLAFEDQRHPKEKKWDGIYTREFYERFNKICRLGNFILRK